MNTDNKNVVSDITYLNEQMDGIISAASATVNSIKFSISSTTSVPSKEPQIISTFLDSVKMLFEKVIDEAKAIKEIGKTFDTVDSNLSDYTNILENVKAELSMVDFDLSSSIISESEITKLQKFDEVDIATLLAEEIPDYGEKEKVKTYREDDDIDNDYLYDDYVVDEEELGQTIIDLDEPEENSDQTVVENIEQTISDDNGSSSLSDYNEKEEFFDDMEYLDDIEDIDDIQEISNEIDLNDNNIEVKDTLVSSSLDSTITDEIINEPVKKKSNLGKAIAGISVAGAGVGAYTFYKKKKENDDMGD